MCYARRQRSSWARIKLSDVLYIMRFALNIFCQSFFLASFLLFEFQSILTRFFVWLCQSLFESFSCSIFKDRFAPLPQQRSTSISHTFLFVNTFFRFFFDFFWFFSIFPFSACFCIIMMQKQAIHYPFWEFQFQNSEENKIKSCIFFKNSFLFFLFLNDLFSDF